MTWVLVADARRARIFAVADAGLPPKLLHSIQALPDGSASDKSGDLPEVGGLSKRATAQQGALRSTGRPADGAEHRFARELVRMLERGLTANGFQHLVLVAPPKLLGILREALTRGLTERLRASEHKDYEHLRDRELEERVRPLVHIWPVGTTKQ
jgi:protein required for attachment to host cells